MIVEWTYNKETRIPDGAEGCQRKSSQVLVVTATHDLENWCVHNVIGLEHGGALVVLQ